MVLKGIVISISKLRDDPASQYYDIDVNLGGHCTGEVVLSYSILNSMATALLPWHNYQVNSQFVKYPIALLQQGHCLSFGLSIVYISFKYMKTNL